jgi:hypothetical protein
MRTRDQTEGSDVLSQIMERLDRIEQAVVLLAGGGSEGEEGNPDEGPQTSNSETGNSFGENGEESDDLLMQTQAEKNARRQTGDRRLTRHLAVRDAQCSRVLAGINSKNRNYYGLN